MTQHIDSLNVNDDDSTGTWELLKTDIDYEISTVYPYQIRKRSNGRIIKESEDNGYLRCRISNKTVFKHKLIALQWKPNPDALPYISHINGNRCDNHIENLEWVSKIASQNRRSNQTFVETIPGEAIHVDCYNNWEFEDLYYHDNQFYKYNGINYVVKPRYRNSLGSWYIFVNDAKGTRRPINYPRFKREYGIIED